MLMFSFGFLVKTAWKHEKAIDGADRLFRSLMLYIAVPC